MKKLFLFLLLCFPSLVLLAQEATVTGKVNITGSTRPPAGITITLKGTTRSTSTDNNGVFTIKAPLNGTLVFTGIGLATREVAINGNQSLTVSLDESITQLQGVVVTALGVQRQKKSLGYATQQISGNDLQIGRENNVVNSLQGRAAGVVINRSSSGPGSSTRISLRGERSLVGNNQPLIVIDGVPVDNTVRGGSTEFNAADGGDAVGNLNPDDIESINILRGPNAAALYGARANNGVLLITTKKGSIQKGVGISFNHNTSFEKPAYSIDLQKQYAQGSSTTSYSATSDESWGPRITGQPITNYKGETYNAVAEDQVNALLQTGLNVSNNISLSTGTEKAQLRLSYNNLYAKGIIPNNSQNRNSFIVRGTSKIGGLNVDVKLNYINQLIKNRPSGGEDALNPYSDILRMPATVRNSDLKDYLNTTTAIPSNNFFLPNSAIIANPYFVVNKVQPNEERNRVIGAITLRQEITKSIGITGRLGLDQYNDENQARFFAGTPTPFTANSAGGNFNLDRFSVRELNADAFLDFKKDISADLSFSGLLGTSLRANRSQSVASASGGLDLPDLFVLSNGRAVTASNSLSRQELQSVYATAQFGYKDALFLDLTGRNDWTSTLPSANRSYFYPSASLSAVLSDLVTLPEWWNYFKLRNSYAFVGKDAAPYSYIQLLNASSGVAGTVLRNDPTLANTNLKPEQTRAYEAGAELGFFNNRITMDLTYYNTSSFNQIIPLPLTVSTGYNQRLINAGNIRNRGVEALLNITVLRNPKGFSWTTGLNYSRNRNTVVELDPQQKTYLLSSTRIGDVRADEGTRIGEMYVRGLLRDASGQVQIGTNGLPQTTSGRTLYAGNVFPDYTAGINNTFKYKSWSLDFLVDGRFGGVVASHTQAVLAGLGKLEQTVAGRDNKDLIVPGVLAGTNTNNAVAVDPRSYWQLVGGRGNPVGELWVYSATAVRLRQATLSYRLPQAIASRLKLNAVDIALYGRNLFFISKKAPFDPEVALNTGLGGQGIDFYSLPTTRTFGLNLNVSF